MFNWSMANEFVASFAGFLSSLTIIVGVIYKWIWKPYEKKKEKRDEKLHATMLSIVKGQTIPISEQLGLLEEQTERHDATNRKLEDIAEQNVAIISEMRAELKEHNRQSDERDKLIAQNAEIILNHEKRLNGHNERLLILETVSGVQNKQCTFKTGKGETYEVKQ